MKYFFVPSLVGKTTYPMKHVLVVTTLLFILTPQWFVCGQHAIITHKGDTIRANYINIDRETDLLEFTTPQYPDSLISMPYGEVKELLYRFYPAYETIVAPTWIINTGFGIKFSFYTPGLVNLDSQPILKEEVSRGTHFSIGVAFMNKKQLGPASFASLDHYYTDRDSLWAKEKFFTAGIGLGWLSSAIDSDFFLAARIMPTYSSYYSEGKVFLLTYHKRENLAGLYSELMLNLHITENLMFQFNTNLHMLHRDPGRDKKFFPTLGTMGISCGFMVFL